jgi:hypothetical protein
MNLDPLTEPLGISSFRLNIGMFDIGGDEFTLDDVRGFGEASGDVATLDMTLDQNVVGASRMQAWGLVVTGGVSALQWIEWLPGNWKCR